MAPETRVPPKMQYRFDDWVQKPGKQQPARVRQWISSPQQQQQQQQKDAQRPTQEQHAQQRMQQQQTHAPSPSQSQYPAPYPPPYPPPAPGSRPSYSPTNLQSIPHPSEILQHYQSQYMPPQQQPTPPAPTDPSDHPSSRTASQSQFPAQSESPADEWTQVQPKSKRKRKSAATQTESDHNKTAAAKSRNPPSRSMTLAKIQSDFNTKTRAWQASECRRMTLSTLDRIAHDGGWNIDKAICLGIGSFGRDNEECRKRSMWQFVIFVDLVRHLQRVGKKDVEMLGQEPMWVEVDGHFLKTLRLKTLAVEAPTESNNENNTGLGPAAEHLGPTTFVYEPFMDMNEPMAREIVDADVALYIGSSMRGLLSKWGAVGELAKQFDEQHLKYQFPRFEDDPNVMEGMGIYWKEGADDD